MSSNNASRRSHSPMMQYYLNPPSSSTRRSESPDSFPPPLRFSLILPQRQQMASKITEEVKSGAVPQVGSGGSGTQNRGSQQKIDQRERVSVSAFQATLNGKVGSQVSGVIEGDNLRMELRDKRIQIQELCSEALK